MDEQKTAKEATNEQGNSKPEAKSEVLEQDLTKEEASKQEPAKITIPIPKDPKKVEAGKLSAISRAAKKRQQQLLQEDHEPHPTFDYKPFLYFGVPSIFLAGMYLWSIRTKKDVVVEFKPPPEVKQQQEPKKSSAISLFD